MKKDNLKYLCIPGFALVAGFAMMLTYMSEPFYAKPHQALKYRVAWIIRVICDSKVLYYLVPLLAYIAAAVLLCYAFRYFVNLLQGLSVKKRVVLCLGSFVGSGAMMVLTNFAMKRAIVYLLDAYKNTSDYYSRGRIRSTTKSIGYMLCFAFAVFGIFVASVGIYLLFKKCIKLWKEKNIQSFIGVFTVIGGVLAIVFAVLTFAFTRLTLRFIKLGALTFDNRTQYYALVAVSCFIIFALSVLLVVKLYNRRIGFPLAKICLVFMLLLGLAVTSYVTLAEYNHINTNYPAEQYEDYGEVIGSTLGIVKLGITGDDVVYVGKDSKGLSVYIGIYQLENYLDKHFGGGFYKALPFAGLVREKVYIASQEH